MFKSSPLAEALYKKLHAASPKTIWIPEGSEIPPDAVILRTEECWGNGGRCKCPILPCRWTIIRG